MKEDRKIAYGLKRMGLEPLPADGKRKALSALASSYPPIPRKRISKFVQVIPLAAGFSVITAYFTAINIVPAVRQPYFAPMPEDSPYHIYEKAYLSLNDPSMIRDAEGALPKTDEIKPGIAQQKTNDFVMEESKKYPSSYTFQPVTSAQWKIMDSAYPISYDQGILQLNEKSIQLIETALTKPYTEPPVRSFNHTFPEFSQDRTLAELLAFKARASRNDSNWQGGMNAALDAVQMGEQLTHSSTLLGPLVGIACESIGRKNAWEILPHLTASQAEEDGKRLESILFEERSWADILAKQERVDYFSVSNVLRGPEFRDYVTDSTSYGYPGTNSTLRSDWFILKTLMHGKSNILSDYRNYMSESLRLVSCPYVQSVGESDPPAACDPINQILDTSYANARFSYEKNRAENHLLLTSLALQAYRAEHGRYPASLALLVKGGFLRSIPNDPFGKPIPDAKSVSSPYVVDLNGERIKVTANNTANLRYLPNPRGYILYSIGPDGKDDGGKPIGGARRKDHNGASDVQQESLGDIVAGVKE